MISACGGASWFVRVVSSFVAREGRGPLEDARLMAAGFTSAQVKIDLEH
jgi:hypothetical protein